MHSHQYLSFAFAFHLSRIPGLLSNFSVSACRSSSGNSMLPRQPAPKIDACLFFSTELLRICDVKSVVLLTSHSVDYWPVSWVLKLMLVHNIRMMHFDGLKLIKDKNTLDYLIWNAYDTNRMQNYLLIMDDPQTVIESIQRVLEATKRGPGALMPHQMRILIIAPESVKDKLLETLTKTSIDNVAVALTCEMYCCFQNIYTLMWRNNRGREFSEIKDSDFFNINGYGKNCRIFPNKKLAMNGRPLVILAKEWLSHLYKKVDQSSGKLQYAGLYVDIIETMSKFLNFSYTFTPEPGEDDNITWEDFANLVGGSHVDLGASTYISNSMLYYNHTVTYPLLWSNVSGVYLNKQSGGVRFPLWLFKPEVYIALLCALVLTMFLFLLLVRLSPRERMAEIPRENEPGQRKFGGQKKDSQTRSRGALVRSVGTQTPKNFSCTYCKEKFEKIYNRSKYLYFVPRNMDFASGSSRNCTVNQTYGMWTKVDGNAEKRRNKSNHSFSIKQLECLPVGDNICLQSKYRLMDDLVGIFFTFVGSIFSQDSVPCPNHLSPRLLLWSWCLMVLVLTATFTGNITADLVGHQDSAPFTTFEELLRREDYKWGLFGESSFFNVMKNAKDGTTLKRLYDGMIHFSQTDPTVVGTFEQQITKLKTEKFVTFFFSGDLEYLKERSEDMSSLVIITDHLMTINMGFVCPKTSKLSELISEELLRMTESGVLGHLLRKKSSSTNKDRGVAEGRQEGSRLDVKYLKGLFYCCGCGVLLAFFILILEIAYMKMCHFVTKLNCSCCQF